MSTESVSLVPFIGGNWKCFNDPSKVAALVKGLKEFSFPPQQQCDVLIAPTYLHLLNVHHELNGKPFHVAAQDVNQFTEGAFTGSISAPGLKSNNITWTLIGHSERRTCFAEDDAVQAAKTAKALEQGINVVFCIGETKDERVGGKTVEVVTKQLEAVADLLKKNVDKFVIAYEPVWSIGTGLIPTDDQVRDTHLAIRQWLVKNCGESGNNIRILYGGSVKASNASDLYQIQHVNGFLVGGASLVAKDFYDIVQAAQVKKQDAKL
jgi:triosephosphate isomerase